MADAPDTIVLKRHRDLEGRQNDIWVRRSLMTLVAVVPILALANVFGQGPDSHTLVAPAASLKIYAPSHVRGGLLYEARFHVTARQELKDATLVLGAGWLEGMTVNTIEPSPVNEASDNGRLSLELGHIPQGQSYILFMQFQVNPTNVGRRTQTVELRDGGAKLLSFHRSVTIFP
ncbi:MAG TPA: hypothetical protein VE753_10830 [Gaiellaceae bacterium]|jgi:hypothetical protein|nr:hypothetical protein [Gaiellaceae bacterium]